MVTIIGILAAAVAINVTGYIGKSRRERAKMDLATLKNAVELFYLERQRYPSNEEGLEVLTRSSSTHSNGIVSEVPHDPWGNPYAYRHPGQHDPFEIVCYGRDGAPGGEGEDADIGSWEIRQDDNADSRQWQ